MALRLEDITNRIVSGSATFIALVAMGTAVYQSKLMRDQAKAAVWPYLLAGSSDNDGFARIVQNVGLGPAVIKSFEVRVHGHTVHTWAEAAESLGIHPTWKNMKSTTFGLGIVAPVNSTINVLEVHDSTDVRAFSSHRNEIATVVCYCSLFGDCWVAGDESYEPKPVDRCVEDPKLAFRK